MKRTKELRELLLLTLLFAALTGCGDKGGGEDGETAEALPASYDFGGESIEALLMPAQEITVSQKAMDDKGTLYTYTNLASSGEAAQEYVEQLTSTEPPFAVVDATCTATDALPDFTAEEGELYLAREAEDGESVNLITLAWNAENECKVTVNAVDGQINYPPAAQEQASGSTGMTLPAAVSYFNSLSPSRLGLSGESMAEYNVYALDGTVMVDGAPCLHIKVCSSPGDQANTISGDYLMSGDETRIYRLDMANGTVTEV